MDKKLVGNVSDFIDKCSKEIGKFHDQEWNMELFNDCLDMNTNSPIEQILYCALKTIQHLNYIGDLDCSKEKGTTYYEGLNITPQYSIGNYRVDFFVGHYLPERKKKNQLATEVMIECDSQQFHDRTEQERRYEKQRDRFLQSKGYKIFHYTGAEICQKPMEIAQEIISFVTGKNKEDILIDSNLE